MHEAVCGYFGRKQGAGLKLEVIRYKNLDGSEQPRVS